MGQNQSGINNKNIFGSHFTLKKLICVSFEIIHILSYKVNPIRIQLETV